MCMIVKVGNGSTRVHMAKEDSLYISVLDRSSVMPSVREQGYLIRVALCVFRMCLTGWPRGLRRRSAAARFLGLRVRISPKGMHSLVNVVCCQVEVFASEESYRVWCV
jgi:hypothetical protein